MKIYGRRRHRGQAMVEAALVMPILLMLSLGVLDVGRFVSDQSIATAQAAAGLPVATGSLAADVGTAVRSENPVEIPDTAAAWGRGYTGGVDDCLATDPCGDPSGCVPGSSYWTVGVIACYSAAWCPLNGGVTPATCDPSGHWGMAKRNHAPPNWPAAEAGEEIVVRVVLAFHPVTPYAYVVPRGGTIYVTRTVTAPQDY